MKKQLLGVCSLLGIFIFVAVGWGLFMYQHQQHVPVSYDKEDLIRLHVLANSDSTSDQQLKLKVRDAIIAYLAPYLEYTATKADAQHIVLEHKDRLTAVAQQILVTNGANYPVAIQVGLFDFPIKSYGSLVLPAGKYEAVRVLVGEAEGKNWWCVLFPPLCFVDITTAVAIPAKELADNGEQQVEFRSKIAELWRKSIK